MTEDKFAELLFGSFIDILRTAGAAPNSFQMEQMRDKCQVMGNQFAMLVRSEAIEVARDLQKAVEKAFVATDEKFKEFEKFLPSYKPKEFKSPRGVPGDREEE